MHFRLMGSRGACPRGIGLGVRLGGISRGSPSGEEGISDQVSGGGPGLQGAGCQTPGLAQKWPGPFLSKGPWSSEGEQHRSEHPDRDPPQARDLRESWEGAHCDGDGLTCQPRELGAGRLPFIWRNRRKVTVLIGRYWMVASAHPPATRTCRLPFRESWLPLLQRGAQLPDQAGTTGSGKPSW